MSYPPPVNPFTPPAVRYPAYTCAGEQRSPSGGAGYFTASVKVEEPPQYYPCRFGMGRARVNNSPFTILFLLQGVHPSVYE